MPNQSSTLSVVLSIVAIIFSASSVGLSGYSVWLTNLQRPHLDIFLGESIFVSGEPTIGLSCTITNVGARGKVINHLSLELKGSKDTSPTLFEVRSVSPSLFSWLYEEKSRRMVQQTNVVHGPFVAFEVPAKGEANKVLWLIPAHKSVKFEEGEYSLLVRAYGDTKQDVAAERTFTFKIGTEDRDTLVSQPSALRQVVLSQWQ